MYVNSGGRPGPMEHLHVYGFDVYRFALDAFRGRSFPPNTPAPTVVFKADGAHDSHGMVTTGGDRYLWVMDRHGDVVEVIATSERQAHPIRAAERRAHRQRGARPERRSPAGDRLFVAFRGPTPLSGDPHNAKGATPGSPSSKCSTAAATGGFSG